MRARGIGPLDKWVDDHVFFCILHRFLHEVNRRRAAWRRRILDGGGRQHLRGRIWFAGSELPDGRVEESSDDMAFPLRDLSHESPRSLEDARFTYAFTDIDALSAELGYPWEISKDSPFASSRKTWFNNLVLIYTNLPNHTHLLELVIIYLN